jgi:DNA-directed RNA polymerase I subunit RPA1
LAKAQGAEIRSGFFFMSQYGYALDVNKIYSNDIGAIRKCYGVEAARAAIMREVSGVFKVYGIAVDMRHLSLIADYMVCQTPPTPTPSFLHLSLISDSLPDMPTLVPRGQII